MEIYGVVNPRHSSLYNNGFVWAHGFSVGYRWLLCRCCERLDLAFQSPIHPSNIHHIVMVESLQGPLFSFPSCLFLFFLPCSSAIVYTLL